MYMASNFQSFSIRILYNRTSNAMSRKSVVFCGMILACLLLVACTGGEHGDLQVYIEQIMSRHKGHVTPIPEVPRYEIFSYQADQLRDPFTQYVDPNIILQRQQVNALHPNKTRKREALEQFPIDALLYVGHLEKGGVRWGLISAPDETVYRIQVGHHLGQNYGEILSISDTAVQIKEIISDGAGGWTERENSITLIESE